MVEQGEDLVGVEIDAVQGGVLGMVAAPVSEQVEQHHPVPPAGQGFRDTAVDLGVEQQAVQIDEQTVSLTVHLVGEVLPLEAEGPGLDARGGPLHPWDAPGRDDGLVGEPVEGLGRHASSLRGRELSAAESVDRANRAGARRRGVRPHVLRLVTVAGSLHS